jgi:TP901 family phage tail tape measure protein
VNLYAISVQLSANAAQYTRTLRQASADAKDFSNEVYKAAEKGNSATRKLGTSLAAFGAIVAAVTLGATYAAVQLEQSMQNVATIWDENQQLAEGTFVSIKNATSAVIDLSTELPQSAKVLAEGLYDIASSGFQGAEALDVLKVAGTAASAGLTDTATAARAITAVLNAYGDEAAEASRISDVLFQTVNLGVVSFPELANVLGDFVGLTATAKVPIEEAGAALATMTLSGVSAAEAGTSINRVMKSFIKPGEDMAAMLHRMGYETGAAALEQEGLMGIMEKLAGEIGYESVTAWTRLFPEIRATRGALALIADEGENFRRVSRGMNEDSNLIGATQRALAEQSKSTAFQLTILKNQVVALGISFGQSLLPVIKPIVEGLQDLVGAFAALPEWLKTSLAIAVLLAGGIAAVTGAFLLLAPSIAAATALISGSTVAMGLLTAAFWRLNAAMPVIAAIGATAAIAAPFILKWAAAHGEGKKRVDDLKKSLDAETGAVTDNTLEIIRNRMVQDDLIAKAAAYGISVETLTRAMLGESDAIAQVNTAIANGTRVNDANNKTLQDGKTHIILRKDAEKDLKKAIGETNSDLTKGHAGWEADKQQKQGLSAATAALTRDQKAQAAAHELAMEAAEEESRALKDLQKQMLRMLDPINAYDTGLEKLKASESHARDEGGNAIEAWSDRLRRVLDDDIEWRQRALDDEFTARKRQLDDKYEAEIAALDKENEAFKRAMEERHEVQKALLDDEERAYRDALDDRQRAETQALNADLRILDRAFNERKMILERQQSDEEDLLLAQIDQLFGEERQAAINQLFALKVEHASELDELDEKHDKEEQAKKDALTDQHRLQDNAYEDEKEARAEKLEDAQEAETDANDDEYARKKTHIGNLKEIDERRYEDDRTRQERALEDQNKALQRKLDDQIAARRNTHQRERELSAEQRPLTLAEYQTTLDAQYAQYEAHNVNMALIAGRGGLAMSSAVMAEISKLPPNIVAEVAKAGPATFDEFLKSMKARADAANPAEIGGPIVSLLRRIGEMAGPEFAKGLASRVAGDPQAAAILQAELFKLIAPKEISPGVWATPKPGGGFYPGKMTFAEGGFSGREASIRNKAILWAEAGPEAYIPLDQRKAGRSVGLLGQVADFYGYGLTKMAVGGVLRSPGSLSANSAGMIDNRMSIEFQVHVNVAAGVDADAVGLAVRRELRREIDNMGRQIMAAGGRG